MQEAGIEDAVRPIGERAAEAGNLEGAKALWLRKRRRCGGEKQGWVMENRRLPCNARAAEVR